MLKEFREFIARGNVMDLAVAVVMGAAFTAIVNSLVDDIIMPLIGVLMGGIDFSTLSIQVGDATIMYGNFIQAVINFLIIACCHLPDGQGNESRPPSSSPHRKKRRLKLRRNSTAEEKLLTEIRDLLEAQKG